MKTSVSPVCDTALFNKAVKCLDATSGINYDQTCQWAKAGASSHEAVVQQRWWMMPEGAELCTGPETCWKAQGSLYRTFFSSFVAEKIASGRIIVFSPHSALWQVVVLSVCTTPVKCPLFSWCQHKKGTLTVNLDESCAYAWPGSNG